MNEIIIILISTTISTIATLIISKVDLHNKKQKEIYDNYYAEFHTL